MFISESLHCLGAFKCLNNPFIVKDTIMYNSENSEN